MKEIVLIGAGKIGEMIAMMLADTGDYRLTVADRDAEFLARLPKHPDIRTLTLDVDDGEALARALAGKFAVLSAGPHFINRAVAGGAKKAGCHFLDLTEDVSSTRAVKELAEGAGTAFIPQCGLAPGFISIVANDLARRFDSLHEVRMRVGALPKYPSNALKYNLTWSTDGLINEYCNPCEAIVGGELLETPPLAELEAFSLDGVNYEAFNTSGGLGTLCDTLKGRVQILNYKTVRYPGHRDILKMLIHDLRLGERRALLKEIFEHALPITMQDVVLIFVTVSGQQHGRFVQESFARKVYSREMFGRTWSAIQITTASGICAMLDLLAEGKLPHRGLVRQEEVDFSDFIANRFGHNFAANGDGLSRQDRPGLKIADPVVA